MVRSTLILFGSSLLSGILCFFLAGGLFSFAKALGLPLEFGGDKSHPLFCLLTGLPVGSVLGLLPAEKYLLKTPCRRIPGILVSLLFGLAGAGVGLLLMDVWGGSAVYVVPVIVAVSSLSGYKMMARVFPRPAAGAR